jgi:hypothetical protein
MDPNSYCCDDLRGAHEITFLVPLPDQAAWLAYGTDFETTSAGAPELRFWPVRFCPFCGTPLPEGRSMPRRTGAGPPPP